ncbi:Pyruvate/2-oxoglutarate dehydrogenase complex [Sinorhizobium sojae CCBAU 05684]|uniref:Pyruvate/2-oxoglutarate dehydrogenase complex n=2 Tax=Sinorhizobium sojae TaxID=716925 RepID=A0A249PAN8_9HYPH|nr:Pyruvate/2-oxoglutarate dehydrogenase complex [Sinorhizobium sojae CCBAU 05684]
MALFLKGYALLAMETPELRRAYVKLPRPQLYEYPGSIASVAHEREYEGERVVLLSLIKNPERRTIRELGALLEAARTRPVLEIKEFRRALKIARAPAPIRWLLMWLGLNLGRQRARHFGTFQLSVYSGLGAESLNPLTPLTTLFNYGPITEQGLVTVRIHYDHRVMDGANVARALARLEEILNGEVAFELASLAERETVDREIRGASR